MRVLLEVQLIRSNMPTTPVRRPGSHNIISKPIRAHMNTQRRISASRIQMPGSSLLLEYPQLSCLEFYNGIRTTDPEALSTGRLKRPLVDTEEQQVLVAELHYKM